MYFSSDTSKNYTALPQEIQQVKKILKVNPKITDMIYTNVTTGGSMRNSFFVFLAAIALIFTGCGNKADYESEEAGKTVAVVKGFYGFDGTGEHLRDDGSVVGSLFLGFDGHKIYFPGQDLLSTYSEKQATDATTRICRHVREKGVNRIYMSGYSRGAIIAIEVANRVKKSCGDAAKLQWMGLVDAVNLSLWNFSSKVPDGMATVHLKKKKQKFEPHTKVIQASPLANWTMDDFDHNHIGYEDKVKLFLTKHSAQQGASYRSIDPIPEVKNLKSPIESE